MPEQPDFRPYWLAWERRLHRRAEELRAVAEQRRSRAAALLSDLADHLFRKYRVSKVVLVGSLARGDFGPDSDIDLVVEGLPAEALFRAGAELERLAGDIGVDLVPLESATPRLKAALDREGVVLRGHP